MKFTAIILLSACLTASANGFSQKVTLSEKNARLENVFEVIKSQTGYKFLYTVEQLKKASLITIDLKAVELEDALNALFKGQPLTYSIIEKTVVIKPKAEESIKENLPPPVIDVRGRLVNENGEPVIASVQVKGDKSKGTTSNDQGYFELKGINENAILVVSGINIETFEIKVDGRTDVSTVSVKTKVNEGEAVVVNTGYQRLSPERTTGSFSKPNAEMFNSRVTYDVISRLKGITNGVLFNQDGEASSMSIRGRSTIFANADPLIVVDNFPYEGSLSSINPNDIEDITVLKDAAAASIWGARSGNGVIVITTKQGKSAQPLRVQFSSNYTIQKKPNLHYDPGFIPSSSFIDFEQALFQNGFYTPVLTDPSMPVVSPIVEILNKRSLGLISAQEAASQINGFRNIDSRDELLKNFYRENTLFQNAINFQGGTDKLSYYFSTGYDKIRSNRVAEMSERFTISANQTYRPIKRVQLSTGIFYVQGKSVVDNVHSLLPPASRYPYVSFENAQGSPLSIPSSIRMDFAERAESFKFQNWQLFPLNETGLDQRIVKNTDVRLNSEIRIDIIKGLTASLSYQYQNNVSESERLSDSKSFYSRNLINTFSKITASNVTGYNIPLGSIVNQGNNFITANNIRGQLTYSKNWEDHSVNVVAGAEQREVKTKGYGNVIYGYDRNTGVGTIVDLLTNFSRSPGGVSFSRIPGGGNSITGLLDRFRSYYSLFSYSYKGKYTLTGSGRVDGSNYFGVETNQKFQPLYSLGAKWEISKEKFYSISWLPELRARLTYGYNGNLDKTQTAITTFRNAGNTGNTNVPFAVILNIPNPELRWERIGITNIGIEFGTKRDIVSGSIEYYRKNGKDILGDAPLDPTTGARLLRGNYSAISGQGFDIQVSVKNIDRIFKWQTTYVLNTASTNVTDYKLPVVVTSVVSGGVPIVGKPIAALYSYKWAGLDPATGDPQGYSNGVVSKNYSNLTFPQKLDELVYHGSAAPTVFGNIINSLTYKDVSLSFSINYKLGYFFRRRSISYNQLLTNGNAHNDYLSRWQMPGDELTTFVPSMVYPANTNRDNFYNYSEVLVEKGDHIRLQDVSITYTLPKSLSRSLQGIQIYGYVNNIGILWRANHYGLDPDFFSGAIPPSMSFSFGVRAQLK